MGLLSSLLKALWPFGRRPAPRPEPLPPKIAVPPVAPPEPLPPEPGPPEPVEALQPGPVPDEAPALEPALEPAAEPPPAELAPAAEAAVVAVAVWSEDDGLEDEVLVEEEEALDDPAEPDPFVTGTLVSLEPAPIENLAERRREARARALAGEHRIYLSEAAGPGSLAEALNILLEEGLVTAEFREDEAEGPHLHYRPVAS